MTIQANIKAAQAAEEAARDHCMCARYHDDGQSIHITYPAGDWPAGIDGIRGCYAIEGKAKVLSLLVARMERDWLDSFPGKN